MRDPAVARRFAHGLQIALVDGIELRRKLKDNGEAQMSARGRERDRHCCQVPGCSRPSVHAHHIKARSQRGTDDEWNLVSLCAAHHLHGIHWEFDLRRSYAATAVA